MPIVDVELVGDSDQPVHECARRIADELGEVFGSARAQTWVRIRNLPSNAYAENGEAEPLGARAVFVTVLKHSPDEPSQREVEALRIAELVSTICARPREHVHVLYEPPAAARIAFGGKLIV